MPPISTPNNRLYIVRARVHDRYKNLINYLANGRWREADEETYQVMLEVTGRKEQRSLDVDSIKTFPCEDLQLIDQLWLKFSGGHFGFSVQKQIWVEVGGKLDYGEDEDADWDAYQKLSTRVGWRTNDKWLSYLDYTFNLDGKYGYLPWGGWGGIRDSVLLPRIQKISILASRLVTCYCSRV